MKDVLLMANKLVDQLANEGCSIADAFGVLHVAQDLIRHQRTYLYAYVSEGLVIPTSKYRSPLDSWQASATPPSKEFVDSVVRSIRDQVQQISPEKRARR